jgi:hypothetical protein
MISSITDLQAGTVGCETTPFILSTATESGFEVCPQHNSSAPDQPGEFTLGVGASTLAGDVLHLAAGLEDGSAGAITGAASRQGSPPLNLPHDGNGDAFFDLGLPVIPWNEPNPAAEPGRIELEVEPDAPRSELGLLSIAGSAINISWRGFTPSLTTLRTDGLELLP